MLTQNKEDFAFRAHLDLPYEQAREQTIAALKEEGFGILTEVDVQAILREKIGADFRRYTILGACNPPLAHTALTQNPDIGLMLPCKVIVFERDAGGSEIAIANPEVLMRLVGDPALEGVACDARDRLARVAAALTSGS